MLRKKLALISYLAPLTILLLSPMTEYTRVDANPPISVSADANILSMDVEAIATTDETYSYYNDYIPVITIHQEDVVMPEPEFEPIGKYYDELKHGYLKFDGKLQKYLWDECNENGTNFYLIMAQICEESTYNVNACGHNNNGTTDMGLPQINSRYLDYFSDLMGREIDPYNPYDAIDWLIFFYNYEKKYWVDKGLTGDKLDMAILGSYNKGRDSMTNYIRNNGYTYYYNKDIMFREEQLIREHGI